MPKSRREPLTFANLPASYRRCMGTADLAHAGKVAGNALPHTAPDRYPPDGWRARMNPAGEIVPQTEHAMQAALFTWADAEIAAKRLPALAFLFAVPNGGQRSKAQAAKLKAEGVRAGVPDVFLPVPRAGFCGAVVEMKVHPNKPTDAQAAWLDALQSIGHRCAVCYSVEEAKNFFSAYLGETPIFT